MHPSWHIGAFALLSYIRFFLSAKVKSVPFSDV